MTTLTLTVLDRTGDSKSTWNTTIEAEVEAARAMFNSLRAKGYMIYRVLTGAGKDGAKGEVMNTFDPEAGAMIAAPRITAG